MHLDWTTSTSRLARCITGGIAFGLGGAATAAETTNELWPELQAWWRLTPTTQLLFNPAPTRSPESDERIAADWGLYLDYRVPKDPASYRIGYVYSVSDPESELSRRVEHRVVLDFNYRWDVGTAGKVTDRTRLDLRDIEGTSSQRLRNRVQYEFESTLGDIGFVPYTNFEIFYDTRFHAISRYKFELGATFVFSPQVELTPYYGRQIDTKPARVNINALGLTLGLRF